MNDKLNFQKSIALLILTVSFFLSLVISPQIEGQFQLKWHPGVIINFIISTMYLVVMGREVNYRDWSATGAVLTLGGTFLGVFAITNIILVSPFDGYGLWLAFLIELLVIINFRNLFMPFHQKGRQLTLNLLMVVLICVIFKYIVLVGKVPYLKINTSMISYLNMPLTAAIWMASLALSFIGLVLMRHTIMKDNEFRLEVFKNNLGLERKHLLVLEITNEDLIGLTQLEIDDLISIRVRKLMSDSKRIVDLEAYAKQLPDPENSWAAPLFLGHHHVGIKD